MSDRCDRSRLRSCVFVLDSTNGDETSVEQPLEAGERGVDGLRIGGNVFVWWVGTKSEVYQRPGESHVVR